MSNHPAYLHMLGRLLVGADRPDQLRATDPAGYKQLLHRVRTVRRAWWAQKREAG